MAERPPARLGEALKHARAVLAAAGLDDPGLEARLLVEHFAGTTRTDAVTDPGRELTDAMRDALGAALARRAGGMPVHRVIGHRDFHGVRLSLSPATLDPRPDTEAIVDLALELLARRPSPAILDLGTGSGAIALAVLAVRQDARAVGVDLSEEALATAVANAAANGVADRFEAVRSDWLAAVSGRYDAILSNPPYISTEIIDGLDREVREHDPRIALDGGADGLDAYRAIAADAAAHLTPGGVVIVEIGYDQAATVPPLFEAHGFMLAGRRNDLAGTVRGLAFTLADAAAGRGQKGLGTTFE